MHIMGVLLLGHISSRQARSLYLAQIDTSCGAEAKVGEGIHHV